MESIRLKRLASIDITNTDINLLTDYVKELEKLNTDLTPEDIEKKNKLQERFDTLVFHGLEYSHNKLVYEIGIAELTRLDVKTGNKNIHYGKGIQ